MLEWLEEYKTLFWWLTAASVVMFVVTLIAIPMLIARIPTDYFAKDERPISRFSSLHPVWKITLGIIKNAVGVVLILAGLVMLLLPGEGVLTIVIALVLLDVPGKYRFQRWLVTRPRVNKAINWLRKRAGREPLNVDDVVASA